jgi:hypothetical protein
MFNLSYSSYMSNLSNFNIKLYFKEKTDDWDSCEESMDVEDSLKVDHGEGNLASNIL